MQYWAQIVKEWDILMDAKVLSVAIFLCGFVVSYGFARWRYAKQIQLQKTQAYIQKERLESLKDENTKLLDNAQPYKSKNFADTINIQSIRSQVFQTIEGAKLIEKWGVKPVVLLNMVKFRLIDTYAPDQDIILNETESDLEGSLGFYCGENETDEDTITRFRFKPKDIARFEKIAENYQTTT